MTTFCSLYLPGVADTSLVSETVEASLARHQYSLYQPFGLLPGKAYPKIVRLFIAPPRAGWLRVLASPELTDLAPFVIRSLSLLAPCLLIGLDGSEARVEAYASEQPVAPETAFAAYARDPNCVRAALDAAAQSGSGAALGGIALDTLPNDVQALAHQVDLKQAESMFARLSGSLAAKTGGDAGDLLRQPEWDSAGGRKIRALMDCLRIPDWQTPDFVTLRDAYALHKRRHDRPNAALYPGDAEALAAVPDALAYTPIYAGSA